MGNGGRKNNKRKNTQLNSYTNENLSKTTGINKEALKIHGLYHEHGFSSDSDSGKSDFDEEYYKYKPPPIKVSKHQIVTIQASRANSGLNSVISPTDYKETVDLEQNIRIPTNIPSTSLKKKNLGSPEHTAQNNKHYNRISRTKHKKPVEVQNITLQTNSSRTSLKKRKPNSQIKSHQPEIERSTACMDKLKNQSSDSSTPQGHIQHLKVKAETNETTEQGILISASGLQLNSKNIHATLPFNKVPNNAPSISVCNPLQPERNSERSTNSNSPFIDTEKHKNINSTPSSRFSNSYQMQRNAIPDQSETVSRTQSNFGGSTSTTVPISQHSEKRSVLISEMLVPAITAHQVLQNARREIYPGNPYGTTNSCDYSTSRSVSTSSTIVSLSSSVHRSHLQKANANNAARVINQRQSVGIQSTIQRNAVRPSLNSSRPQILFETGLECTEDLARLLHEDENNEDTFLSRLKRFLHCWCCCRF